MIDRVEPRVFYGWWVALAFAIIIFLSTGIRFAVGPFLKPMAADLGLDRGSFSLVIAISLFLYGAVMPLVGALVDRIGSRVVCAAGGCLVAASLELSSRMTSYAEFVFYYGVVASLGLVSLFVPVVTWCILRLGWRGTCSFLALVTLGIVLALSLLVLRDSPEAMGLAPDGAAGPAAGASGERTPMTAAVRAPAFWQLAGGMAACGFSMSLVASHGVPCSPTTASTP
jgi:sugar phosphate permease